MRRATESPAGSPAITSFVHGEGIIGTTGFGGSTRRYVSKALSCSSAMASLDEEGDGAAVRLGGTTGFVSGVRTSSAG